MAQIKVGIIDDGYPVMDENRFSIERINALVQNENWGSEESLRDLNIRLTSESLISKKRIRLEGFNHPETFITAKEFDSDFLIYDWEYKPICEPHDQLLEILKLTTSKIFIYSGWDKFDKISETLDEQKFKVYREANRYEVLSKSDDEHSDKIIQNILKKFHDGEVIKWNQMDLTIKPSKFIIDSEDFWLLRALIGSENIVKFLTEEKTSVLEEDSIQKMFEQSTFKFFIDKHKSILSASNNQLVASKLGDLTELSIAEAANIFGIEKLEEAREKGFTTIK